MASTREIIHGFGPNKEFKGELTTEFEKCIVRIATSNHDTTMIGCGVVIAHKEKNYIVSTAHLLEDMSNFNVCIKNAKYEVRPLIISKPCDLALLEIIDLSLNEHIKAASLGNMVKVNDKIIRFGYEMGKAPTISKGIVNNIKTDVYAASDASLLIVDTDACSISGGGIDFLDGKVVGICFQGTADRFHSMSIPIPIINRFLTEAFRSLESHTKFQDFPELPLECKGSTILTLDESSDVFKKLKANDVLLEIDSLQVSEQGTVNIPNVGDDIHFNHLCHMKFIGDSIRLKVLRNEIQVLEFDVLLDRVITHFDGNCDDNVKLAVDDGETASNNPRARVA